MCGSDWGSWCNPSQTPIAIFLLAIVIILVALVITQCIRLGVRQTFTTLGLWPHRRHRRRDDPDAGKDLVAEARTRDKGVAQEWRVTIALHSAPGAGRDRQRRRDVAEEMRDRRLGEVVGQGKSRVRVYVNSHETAKAAAQVARDVTGQHGLSANVSVECWHPLERLWADAATASRHNLAEEARISHDHQQQEDRRHSVETGVAQWQVWAELRTHHDTVALAKRLSADGQSIVRRWKSLVAGANSEDDAHRLAETIQSYTATDAKVHVKRTTPAPVVPPPSHP